MPTRRARPPSSSSLALGVYWLQALGWPMAKGRDTWDYLAYYLQLGDSEPPLDMLQLFRTPLTPLAVGLPLDLGGHVLLEIVFGLFYAASVLAWSATALTFGRLPALLAAALLLVYPAWATLYHQASSDAVFATGLALWALLLARTLARPSTWRFAALGAGIAALVLIRPANQVLLPAVLAALLVPVPVAPATRLVRASPRGRGRDPRRLGAPQRDPLRRRDRRARRPRVGAVPPRLARGRVDRA